MSIATLFNCYAAYYNLVEEKKTTEVTSERTTTMRKLFLIALVGIVVDIAFIPMYYQDFFTQNLEVLSKTLLSDPWDIIFTHTCYICISHGLFSVLILSWLPYIKKAALFDTVTEKFIEVKFLKLKTFVGGIGFTLFGIIESHILAVLIALFVPYLFDYFISLVYIINSLLWWNYAYFMYNFSTIELEANTNLERWRN